MADLLGSRPKSYDTPRHVAKSEFDQSHLRHQRLLSTSLPAMAWPHKSSIF
jgi:hypothetical protein